jgi:hypothetical protein
VLNSHLPLCQISVALGLRRPHIPIPAVEERPRAFGVLRRTASGMNSLTKLSIANQFRRRCSSSTAYSACCLALAWSASSPSGRPTEPARAVPTPSPSLDDSRRRESCHDWAELARDTDGALTSRPGTRVSDLSGRPATHQRPAERGPAPCRSADLDFALPRQPRTSGDTGCDSCTPPTGSWA